MGKPFQVLLIEKIDEAGIQILEEVAEIRWSSGTTQEILAQEARDADAIIVRAFGSITATIMDASPRLKLIGKHGVGFDNIDIKAATERGIPVVYTPFANTDAVADHTMGLMIALAKRIAEADRALKHGASWGLRYELIGTDVAGKTLGIIGLGRIGGAVAKRAGGFGMRILAYDPYAPKERAIALGAELVDLDTLLRSSDFVSIHVPLTEETRGLVGRRELSLMKRGAFLINTSRGGIVDEEALLEALSSGHLAGAALDVLEKEPPEPENPLIKMENVIVTPHMAAHTKETLRKMAVTVAEDVVRVLRGERPLYLVNPEAFEGPRIRSFLRSLGKA
jgi:D-3-phosphoglycerate dehydrogenase